MKSGLPSLWKFLRSEERGYTLVEMVVVVGIIAVIAMAMMPSFAGNPAEVSSRVRMVSTMIDEASALAFANGADAEVGRGATVQFTTDEVAGETVGRVYWGRPYTTSGIYAQSLLPDRSIPEVRTKVHIRVDVLGNLVDPPFAIFISPSGHSSTAQGYYVVPKQYVVEHPCSGDFIIEFYLGAENQRKNISCNYARILL